MEAGRATGAQIGEGLQRHQGGHPTPKRSPHQGSWGRARQTHQGRCPEQQQQDQGLNPCRSNAAVIHRLQGPRPCRQAIGGIHGAIEVQSAAQQHSQGQHQRHLGHQGHPATGEDPEQRLQPTQHHPHQRRKTGNSLKPRLDPRPRRQHGIEHPGASPIPQPGRRRSQGGGETEQGET